MSYFKNLTQHRDELMRDALANYQRFLTGEMGRAANLDQDIERVEATAAQWVDDEAHIYATRERRLMQGDIDRERTVNENF